MKEIIEINGIEISSGFTVEFDSQFNVKVNGQEVDPRFLGNVAGYLYYSRRELKREQENLVHKEPVMNTEPFIELDQVALFSPKITTRRKQEGIYVIDGIYVGRTVHLRRRIKQHINNAMRDGHCNPRLGNYLKGKINAGEKINIQWLNIPATDVNEINQMKILLDSGVDLFNMSQPKLQNQ